MKDKILFLDDNTRARFMAESSVDSALNHLNRMCHKLAIGVREEMHVSDKRGMAGKSESLPDAPPAWGQQEIHDWAEAAWTVLTADGGDLGSETLWKALALLREALADVGASPYFVFLCARRTLQELDGVLWGKSALDNSLQEEWFGRYICLDEMVQSKSSLQVPSLVRLEILAWTKAAQSALLASGENMASQDLLNEIAELATAARDNKTPAEAVQVCARQTLIEVERLVAFAEDNAAKVVWKGHLELLEALAQRQLKEDNTQEVSNCLLLT